MAHFCRLLTGEGALIYLTEEAVMKALFIGGTGTISSAISARAVDEGWDLWLLNRGFRGDRVVSGATVLTADINSDETAVADLIRGMNFDVVVDFIAFVPGQIERDVRLFAGKTRQFIFISSASAYQTPPESYLITEDTPLDNPLWEYSRNKIACENYLRDQCHTNGFPVTIVRPSHTYDDRYLPVAVHGSKGSWQVVDRIMRGKPVLIHGDGTSLWTLTHSEDFAKAFCGIMGNEEAVGQVYQITGDESLTWNRIYDCIGEALGKPVHQYHVTTDFLSACDPEYAGTLGGDKAHSVVFDNTRVKNLVPDYRAVIPFSEGAARCVRYLLSTPEAQIADPAFDQFCERVISAQEAAKNAFFASITR